MTTPLFQPRFSSNSWHARLHRYVYEETPDYHVEYRRISICKYFWSTVLAVILIALIVPIYPFYWIGKKAKANVSISRGTRQKFRAIAETSATILLAIIGFGFVLIVASLVVYAAFLWAWWLPLTVVGAGTSIILGVWGLVELYDHYKYSSVYRRLHNNYDRLYQRYLRWRGEKKPEPVEVKQIRPPKKSNLTWSYLKAKKGQVCPMIIWGEE